MFSVSLADVKAIQYMRPTDVAGDLVVVVVSQFVDTVLLVLLLLLRDQPTIGEGGQAATRRSRRATTR
jgi:hypothetical protein